MTLDSRAYHEDMGETLADYVSVEDERIRIVDRIKRGRTETTVYAGGCIIAKYNSRRLSDFGNEAFREKLVEIAEQGLSSDDLIEEAQGYRSYLILRDHQEDEEAEWE
jgi:hypothetical protein